MYSSTLFKQDRPVHQFRPGDLIVTVESYLRPDTGKLELTLHVEASDQIKVDRKDISAWGFLNKPSHKAILYRLKKCIEDLKSYKGYQVCTDVTGQTFVYAETSAFLSGRHMNSSLKRLGY